MWIFFWSRPPCPELTSSEAALPTWDVGMYLDFFFPLSLACHSQPSPWVFAQPQGLAMWELLGTLMESPPAALPWACCREHRLVCATVGLVHHCWPGSAPSRAPTLHACCLLHSTRMTPRKNSLFLGCQPPHSYFPEASCPKAFP